MSFHISTADTEKLVKKATMVITKDTTLPDCKSLIIKECNLSMSTLMSAAPYIGKQCEAVNNEFMLCRMEKKDPRKCVELGKRVTKCTLDLFCKIKNNCYDEFNQYAKCIDKSSGDYSYKYCRKTQAVFDCCMENNLCMARPHFGYFCRGRIHTSPSAAPPEPPCDCFPKIKDPTPGLPECKPRCPPRFGSRFYWMTE